MWHYSFAKSILSFNEFKFEYDINVVYTWFTNVWIQMNYEPWFFINKICVRFRKICFVSVPISVKVFLRKFTKLSKRCRVSQKEFWATKIRYEFLRSSLQILPTIFLYQHVINTNVISNQTKNNCCIIAFFRSFNWIISFNVPCLQFMNSILQTIHKFHVYLMKLILFRAIVPYVSSNIYICE